MLLDNFEHPLDSAALVAELLVRCRLLRCLVTSRAPLRIRGEQELELRPPALPDPERTYSAAELADVPAAALFGRRAASSSSGFQLTDENAKTIGEICRRLDGLPLAIELAAASTRLLTPPALLDRLQRRLPVLVDGTHDLPVRQRTMRSALRWSYDLLGAGERRLFRRLAVFATGAGLEAVQAVYG